MFLCINVIHGRRSSRLLSERHPKVATQSSPPAYTVQVKANTIGNEELVVLVFQEFSTVSPPCKGQESFWDVFPLSTNPVTHQQGMTNGHTQMFYYPSQVRVKVLFSLWKPIMVFPCSVIQQVDQLPSLVLVLHGLISSRCINRRFP